MSHEEGLFKGLSRTAFDIVSLGLCLNFLVPQIIGAAVEKENLFNFLVGEVLEIGMVMQLPFMAMMMCVGSQEWGFII